MRLLAIETSAPTGSIALWGEDGLIEEVPFAEVRNHAAELGPRVQRLLDAHGGLARLEGYAISIGPGSFTGLRIGVSFLKGLAAASPRPAVGVSTLRVMAAQVDSLNPVVAVLDARRGEAFAGLYAPNGAHETHPPHLPDGLYTVASLTERFRALIAGPTGPLTFIGDRVVELPEQASWAPDVLSVPQASTVARLAAPQLAANEGHDAHLLDPAYHQRSAAEVNLGVFAPTDAALHLAEDDGGEVDPPSGRP